jgi:hypothetical protein
MSATSTLRTQSRASASRRCCSVAVLLRRGNPDRRKAISASRCSSNAASRRSCFCLRGSAFRIVAGCRTRYVTPRSSSSCRNHPIEPVASSPTTDWCRQAGVEFPTAPAWCFKVFPTISPAWRSNIAIVCWAACRSHPIIFISASFDPSAVSMDTHSLLRRSRGRRRYDISLNRDRRAWQGDCGGKLFGQGSTRLACGQSTPIAGNDTTRCDYFGRAARV